MEPQSQVYLRVEDREGFPTQEMIKQCQRMSMSQITTFGKSGAVEKSNSAPGSRVARNKNP